MSSTTMTIRVPNDVVDKLARLAKGTRRSRSFLAAEAVAAYVDRELSIIDGIGQAMADVAAGQLVPHAVAMDRVDAAITEVRARRG